MKVTIDDRDVSTVIEVLDAVISDLSYEIANTDNPEFKRSLRERRIRLERARGALADATADPA